MKGITQFGIKEKLIPTFIASFKILEKVGKLAYQILPPKFSKVRNMFHISSLRKYVNDPTHIIEYQPLKIREKLVFIEI